MDLLAQVPPESFWSQASGSSGLYMHVAIALIVGIAVMFGLMNAPTRLRRPIVVGLTFISGLFYVLLYFWPAPIARTPGTLPVSTPDAVGFWLSDALTVVANFSSILSGFLLGLGIYSLVRIHGRKIAKQQKDWGFSAVLMASMVIMIVFGYGDWISKLGANGPKMDNQANWGFVNYARDFFFDGMLQQMDAAMFSVIAFYILSAAYRAFRIRSIEATILLATALIVMLSLMGAVEFGWANAIGQNPPHGFGENFTLTSIKTFIVDNVQNPSLRGIDFGIGIGALAMGLRLWLSLEKAGGTA